MNRLALVACRCRRCAALALALALTGPVTPALAQSGPAQPSPAPAPAGSTMAADQALAIALASDIRAQGIRIAQLSEQADAAAIRQHTAATNLVSAHQQSQATDTQLSATEVVLSEQALAAYVHGGQTAIPGAGAADPDLVAAYSEVVASTERSALAEFHALRHLQMTQEAELAAAQADAAGSVTELRADERSASSAVAQERTTLAGLQGQMAALVASAEAARAAAEAAQEKAKLKSENQLPAPGPPVLPTASHQHVTAPSTTTPPTTSPPTPGATPPGPTPGWNVAIAYAAAQLGKPYRWGGAGPDSFDCSGLVMMAWGAAGVRFPHLAQSQYDLTARLTVDELLPGDLVFFGTPNDVYHVGIYIGGGQMIDAPETGQNVSIQPIFWTDLLGGGRVVR